MTRMQWGEGNKKTSWEECAEKEDKETEEHEGEQEEEKEKKK